MHEANIKVKNCLNSDIQKIIDKLYGNKKELIDYINSIPNNILYLYKD